MADALTHLAMETPFGELHVFADHEGVVRASGFRDEADIALQLPAALRQSGWADGALPQVEAAVRAWLAGDADAITSVPVKQDGGPFFQELWSALRRVPGGEPVSYQDLAAAAGRPRAMRAAGSACARNAVAPFVPCHRVIQAGGKLGSYGFGGAGVKAAMLALEAGLDQAAQERARREAHRDAVASAVLTGVSGT